MELSTTNYHFAGWATCPNLKCTDGRTIGNDAFKWQDGAIVPLVWNHQHNDPTNVVGQALLHSKNGGMYAYGMFNDSEYGQHAKGLVEDGTIRSLSIHANQLRHTGDRCVTHGKILEVSLVYSGANPKAFIETVIKHGEEMDDEGIIYAGEDLVLFHAEDQSEQENETPEEENETPEQEIEHAEEKEDKTVAEEAKKNESTNDRTVKEIFEGAMKKLDEDEQTAVYAVVGMALEDTGDDDADEDENDVNHSEGGDETMKENVFDQNSKAESKNVLTHADQEAIMELAKQSNVGSFKQALKIYVEDNDLLSHGAEGPGVGVFEDFGALFPELELLKKGEPDTIYKNDQSWVKTALAKIHKSPFSRIRTRMADARVAELKAKGYQNKGDEKTIMDQIKVITRETVPQTIYIKDNMHRDDIVDITDFDIAAYQWKIMRAAMDETLVLAALVGDDREFGDPDKIKEDNIRPIWKDDEEYTIHYDVNIEAAREELQGTETNAHFGQNYIYAEAIIAAALYSRVKFKGTGTPDFYCTPQLVNVMLLARDLNGRRIYDSKSELAKALNCNSIVEVEQFEGLERTTKTGAKKKLLGLFVNLNDYTFGSTKGGEITRFEDFDMDFNLKKFMLEARVSGSLYKLNSAIALEEPVVEAQG